jgi:hypothetical protein
LLGLALRVAWIAIDPRIAQGDECEYLRLADNLLRFHRYEGLYEGPQVIYPPLFPLAIAVASVLTRDLHLAGLVVGVLSGLGLVLAMHALAGYVYGRRVALTAALLGACFPALVELSGSVYSQGLYMPLVLAATFFGLRWLDRGENEAALWCGACFGLAYLTRPEAIAGAVVIAVAFVVKRRAHGLSIALALRRTLPLLLVAALFAAPYVAYLSHSTGSLRFEGKSMMNYVIAERIQAGMTSSEAQWGLSPSFEEEGPLLSPNRWILKSRASPPLTQMAGYWLSNAPRTATELRWIVESGAFGGLVTAVLALVGWLRPRWTRDRLAREVVVGTMVGGYVVVLLGQHALPIQYAVPLLPFILIWTANGIDVITQSVVTWARRRHRTSGFAASASAPLLSVLLTFGSLLPAAHGFAEGGEFKSVQPPVLLRKEAGLWLSRQAAAGRVMSSGNEIPFYAHARALRLPDTREDVALAYVHLKAPDFLVLIREQWGAGSYYQKWRRKGVPDPAASLAMITGPLADPDIAIYHWAARESERMAPGDRVSEESAESPW